MVLRRQIGAILLLSFTGLFLWSSPLRAADTADSEAIHDGPCTKTAGGRQVTLDIAPKPVRPMRELAFRVRIQPCDGLPASLVIDLDMPGMVMGRNQVRMSKTGACTWEGQGLFVRCMSGRTLWRATLLSPELDNPAFTFNVRN